MELRAFGPNSLHGVLLLACFFGCVCLLVKGHDCSCGSKGGCIFIDACRPANSCRQRNVALGKQASLSSLYNHPREWNEVSGPACLAVNGNTTTIFNPVNKFPLNPNCVHTADGDHSPYWEVDLGQSYIISTITVYRRTQYDRRILLTNAVVSVDDVDYYTFPSDYMMIAEKTDISGPSVSGRRVRIQRLEEFLSFCEVQVWVCSSGYYGINCGSNCGNCLLGTTCHPISGLCLQGCAAGYEFPYCKERINDAFWNMGTYLLQACRPGTYGVGCTELCGRCKGNSPCNISDGRCDTGCEAGYEIPLCKQGSSDISDKGKETTRCAGHVAVTIAVSIGNCIICFILGFLSFGVFLKYKRRQARKKFQLSFSQQHLTDLRAPVS